MASAAIALQVAMANSPFSKDDDCAITVRPSSTALFCVDSADRYANNLQS